MSRPALKGPAYRIETKRTRLRCFQPSDAALLTRAIGESLEHLRPWMPWALHEPVSFEERVTWLRTQRGNFDLGGEMVYGIFSKDETEIWGSLGLVRGDVDERELGYWVHAKQDGKGIATEAAAALVRVGFVIEDLEAIEVRCLPSNVKSARIPEKLGFSGPMLDMLSIAAVNGERCDGHSYTLSRVEFAHSVARHADIEAYDVLDRRIL